MTASRQPPNTVAERSDWVAFVSLVICSAVAPLSQAMKEIAVGIAVLAWLINKAATRTAPPNTSATLPLCFRFLAGLLSMLNTVSVPTSLRGLFKIAKAIAIFTVTADVMRTKRRIMILMQAVTAGAAVIALDGFLQVIFGFDPVYRHPVGNAPGGIPRLTATFHHANDFALYAVSVLPVCLTVALGAKSRRSRWLSWGVVGALGGSLLLTFSRPAAVSVAASLTAFLMIRRAWRTLAACGIAASLGMAFLPDSIKTWVATQPSWFDALVQPLRKEIWQTALNMIASHPIIGVGVNTFTINYARYKLPTDTLQSAYAHNHYLQLTAETGLVGAAAFGWLLMGAVREWRRLLKSTDPWVTSVAIGLGCGALAFLAMGLLESALFSSRSRVFFWLWLGTLYGIRLGLGRASSAPVSPGRISGLDSQVRQAV